VKKKSNRYSLFQFNGTEDGFTLLELIVTLTILTIIVVLAFGAFRLGIKAWETGDERVDFFYRMKYLVDLMEKEISSSYPYYYRIDNEKKDKILAFQGQPDLISLISSIENHDSSISPVGLRKVTFYFNKDEKQLIKKEEIIESHQPFSKANRKKVRSILLSKDVKDLKFRYYILKKDTSPAMRYEGKWVATFSYGGEDLNNETLPRAVEVTMAIQSQKKGINESIDTFYLPPFVILLNAGMEYRFIIEKE